MKKATLFAVVFILFTSSVSALDNSIRDGLKRLDMTLAVRPLIEAQKRTRIDSLNHAASVEFSPYKIYKELYREYSSYNFDTALIFVGFMEREARPDQMSEVQLCRAFVYLSGGMFKEAADILDDFHTSDSSLLFDYYFTYGRLLCDLADNSSGSISVEYNTKGIKMFNEIQRYLNAEDTAVYWYTNAVLDLREGNYARSIDRCLLSLSATQPSDHYKAIVTSTLASLYRLNGNNTAALEYYIEAAICDILSSTYETVAMRNVAELLFEEEETELADHYIHLAVKDAYRYHARHRQVSIAQSLPIIEEQMLSRISDQRQVAWALLAVVAVLFFIGVAGIIILIRRNKALNVARATIDGMNQSLMEANRLKEELLGTMLVERSKYLSVVQQYQQDVKQHALNRQWNELLSIPKRADARLQRIALERQLDTMLLSFYPTFVQDFNALMRTEGQMTLKKDELLNPQMRIFALIRLGISQNEVIAEILDYSLNTVYSYKTRVISQSNCSPDDFYAALMKIPSFSK